MSGTGSLAGKTAIVTGSSQGIGAVIAVELSSRGANVVLNYPFEAEAANAAKVQQSLATKSICVEADLSTVSGPRKLVEAAVKEFGKIDILVNNAGINGHSPLDSSTAEELAATFERLVSMNGRGTLLMTHAVLPHLNRSSRIVNIGSTTSRSPDAHMSCYSGSKGMIESFTRCWATDLSRKYGCTVNTIAPGPVATQSLLAAPPQFLEELRIRSERTSMASRLARPEDIAWAVAQLCEDSAGWINGQYIPVDGGMVFT